MVYDVLDVNFYEKVASVKKTKMSGSQLSQKDAQALVMLVQSGKHKEAAVKSRKLIKRYPDNPFLYDVLSKSLIALSEFSNAIKPLQRLLELQPGYADGMYNLALAFMNLNQPEASAQLLEEIVSAGGGSADVFTNLGAAYFEMESYDAAIENYKKAVGIDPKYVPALRNLGAGLRRLQRNEEALTYLEKVPFLAPRFAPGHLSLGITYSKLRMLDKARKCFEMTLKLDPDNREAHYEMGVIHAQEGEHGLAISAFAKVDTAEARVKVLEHMHAKGDDPVELQNDLAELNKREPENLRAAAFSAFVSNQYGIKETHYFAPNPLSFVSIRNINDVLSSDPDYLHKLMHEAEDVNAVWENNTTRGGFQTHGNLFRCGEALGRLEDIIRSHLAAYRTERAEANAGIIKRFPKQFDMDGWHVKLMKAGYQKPHIHTRGWVSGVLYLKIPKNTKDNEGAIAFSLHGYDYRKEHNDIPVIEHKPLEGDLVLFPSSLFHHTIPFEADEDRQCIAFDVLPA